MGRTAPSDGTRRWLERRYEKTTEEGTYFAHLPIYGFEHPASEDPRVPRLTRVLQILDVLADLRFDSLLDVGGGEGSMAWWVREFFGARVVTTDLAVTAGERARELFGIDAVAGPCELLPFADDSFDVVLCTEVLEHVEHAIPTILELERVASRAVVLSTEGVSASREQIETHVFQRCGLPHYDRNLIHYEDIPLLFGEDASLRAQFVRPTPQEPISREAAREWMLSHAPRTLVHHGTGVIVTRVIDPGGRNASARPEPPELLDRLLETTLTPKRLASSGASDPGAALLSALRCPRCLSELDFRDEALHCAPCPVSFDVARGVPAFHGAGDPALLDRRLQAALARRHPGEPERVAAILSLDQQLTRSPPPGRSSWDFREMEARRGWLPGEALEPACEEGGGLRYRSPDAGASLIGPALDFPIHRYRSLVLELAVSAPPGGSESGIGQLFWMIDDEASFDSERSHAFPVIADGALHRIEIPIPAGATKGGPVLRCLRIDPFDAPCLFDLQRAEFVD